MFAKFGRKPTCIKCTNSFVRLNLSKLHGTDSEDNLDSIISKLPQTSVLCHFPVVPCVLSPKARWYEFGSLVCDGLESERSFDVAELQRLAAETVTRKVEDIISIDKLGEGAANRAFVIQFCDDFKLVARIPYPVTEPRQHVVASEAATMAFLPSKGIPVPQIYGYSASAENPAQTEYIFMAFSPGRNLGTLWADMTEHHRLRFVRSLVKLECRLFQLRLPASGSLYFLRDLTTAPTKLAVESSEPCSSASFYVGPSTSLPLWYGKRSQLDVDRGPCESAHSPYRLSNSSFLSS
nr:altered inheritance of mitochondria protein 9, mitochondrial [Quercus suber]